MCVFCKKQTRVICRKTVYIKLVLERCFSNKTNMKNRINKWVIMLESSKTIISHILLCKNFYKLSEKVNIYHAFGFPHGLQLYASLVTYESNQISHTALVRLPILYNNCDRVRSIVGDSTVSGIVFVILSSFPPPFALSCICCLVCKTGWWYWNVANKAQHVFMTRWFIHHYKHTFKKIFSAEGITDTEI